VFALVDYDPDGLNILSTYKYGSLNLAHENLHLSLPSLTWIGLKSGHLTVSEERGEEQGLLRLSFRDRRKALCMLSREPFAENDKEPGWRREVQTMLMLNIKAEIQLLERREGGLSSWVKTMLGCVNRN
jgi:meiotic recombination protein SPO11